MTDELAIVAKLRAKRRVGWRSTRGGNAKEVFEQVNPDGPEAAAVIRDLVEALDDAKDGIEAALAAFVFDELTQPFLYATHEKALTALAKVRTPHHPDEGERA